MAVYYYNASWAVAQPFYLQPYLYVIIFLLYNQYYIRNVNMNKIIKFLCWNYVFVFCYWIILYLKKICIVYIAYSINFSIIIIKLHWDCSILEQSSNNWMNLEVCKYYVILFIIKCINQFYKWFMIFLECTYILYVYFFSCNYSLDKNIKLIWKCNSELSQYHYQLTANGDNYRYR